MLVGVFCGRVLAPFRSSTLKARFLAVIAVCLFASQASAAPLSYNVTNLGTLPSGISSAATAINGNGDVAGCVTYSDNSTQAFIWTAANGMQAVGGPSSRAFGINNSDNVVGQTGGQAFRWDPVNGTVLLDPTHGGTANAILNSGTVIGSRNFSGSRTIIWSSTNAISTPFPASNLSGSAINNLNQFAGEGIDETFGYYNNGISNTLTVIGVLPDAMNDSRIAAGSFAAVAAFCDIDTSTTTIIGTLGTDTTSNALGINNAGTIVGVSNGTGAFIYDPTNGLQNLTSELAPAYSGWSILSANAINDNGQIAATGIFDGQQDAVLLTPVPEPSTLVLALLTLPAVFWWRRRRSS